MAKKVFNLTEDHLKLISALEIQIPTTDEVSENDDTMNIFGGGYSLIEEIALLIYGKDVEMNFNPFDEKAFNLTESQIEYASRLLSELPTALKIVLSNKSFETGTYTCKSYLNEWTKVK